MLGIICRVYSTNKGEKKHDEYYSEFIQNNIYV